MQRRSTRREQDPAKRTVINGRKQKNKVREEHGMIDSHAGNETTASLLHFTVFGAFILIFPNLLLISYPPFQILHLSCANIPLDISPCFPV